MFGVFAMKKTILLLFVMLATSAVMLSPSMARGVRLGAFGIHKEAIERVIDFPDTEGFQRSDGKHVDLGYLHRAFGEGEWVGYLGTSSQYLPLSQGQLLIVLASAGVDELPPVPPTPLSVKMAQWMVYGGAAAFGLFVIIAVFRKASPITAPVTPPTRVQRPENTEAGLRKPDAAKGFGRRL